MSELWQKDYDILKFVRAHGSPSLHEIIHGVSEYSGHTIEASVKQLVRNNWLRMKEDSVEHDWTYRVNPRPARAVGEGK
jgi:hypothetical protein